MDADEERRFGGVDRLLGTAAAGRLAAAHVAVVGVGGVGSWAAEALVRTGVRRLTLIDPDHVAVSNVNRQIQALDATLGAAKVEVLRARFGQVSPACRIDAIDEQVTVDNAVDLLPVDADVIVDAIDAPRVKAAMIAGCVARGQAVVVCGAAGARRDPLRLARADLSQTEGDALLASVRYRLRREHGFARASGRRFGVTAIYSTEQAAGARPATGSDAAGAALACAGYGSIVTVTASMGMAAAAFAIELLAGTRHPARGGRVAGA